MRTPRCVIVCLLIFFAAGCLSAQQSAAPEGSVDADLTITGRDDAVIPIPEPESIDGQLVLPPLESAQPDPFLVPPILPPVVDPGQQ
jgi:hypothetical protein